MPSRAGLTQDEIDGCRDAFLAFDKDRSGTIDVWELRQVLEGACVKRRVESKRGAGGGENQKNKCCLRAR